MYHGQLAGDDCRSCAVAIFDDLHQIAALASIQSVWPPVVEDEQIGFDEAAEDFGEPAVAVGEFQLSKKPGQTMIKNRLSFAAGPLAKGTGKPSFTDTGRASDRLPAFQILRYGFFIRFILGRGSWCRLSRIRVMVGARI